MQERSYAKRSWALLTRDKGWIKPVLVLAAANLVPVAGGLGTSGYALEWARLTAWGVDAAPKQKNVQVGTCIHSGWRAFVVALGWGLSLGLVTALATNIADAVPGAIGTLVQLIVGVAVLAVELLSGVVVAIASIRTAIYERIGAGYRVDRVFEMIRRDVSGFFRLVLFAFLWVLAMVVVGFIVLMVVGLSFVPVALTAGYGVSEYAILSALSQTVGVVIILAIVLGYGLAIVATAFSMVFYNAVALWMRQFDVPSWGKSGDPLPPTVDDRVDDGLPQLPSVSEASSQEPARSYPAHQPQDPPVQDPAPAYQPQSAKRTENLNDRMPETTRMVYDETRRLVRDDVEPEPYPDIVPAPAPDDASDGGGEDVDDLYDQLFDVMHRDDRS